MEFFKCKKCGNILAFAENKGENVFCCEQKLERIVPNSTDASQEKHLPVFSLHDNIIDVRVGSVAHPMLVEHNISWVAIETKQGNQRKLLPIGGEPCVSFALVPGDEIKTIYAYCNLHGLWKLEV